jgi:hypothetical protein
MEVSKKKTVKRSFMDLKATEFMSSNLPPIPSS